MAPIRPGDKANLVLSNTREGKMATFTAKVRVTTVETWEVEAKDKDEAWEKFKDNTEDVVNDDAGGKVVDWEIVSVK